MPHKQWLQEYECNFLGTGETYIEGQVLKHVKEGASEDWFSKYNNRMRVWQDPQPHYSYIIAVDVSLGRDRDYSAFHIINTYNGQQVAEFYSNKTPINDFAQILANEGSLYNTAHIVCERNTIGNNLIDWLYNVLEYENLWADEKGDIGFQVTARNRDSILAELEEAIRTDLIKVNSSRTVDELFTFVITENGRVEAEKNCHDDLVMSMALAVHAYRNLLDTTPMEFISNKETLEQRPLPMIKSAPMKTFGGMTKEDLSWLMK
jgi:hypothetical protein